MNDVKGSDHGLSYCIISEFSGGTAKTRDNIRIVCVLAKIRNEHLESVS
jgi:hypothetical protein